ncbi:MAG TPA: MaoC/PaaZ C-terminal domain-containing protein [Candidatus Binataceae bacterium]|nr:MaoC/PaaZ C-terminal domain-containing protein [Candidatus Binataceae bacterium]
MPLNPACLGKQYPVRETRVTREAIERYARACDDLNPRYLAAAEAQVIAPPIFGATVIWPSVVEVMGDPSLQVDMLRLVHSEHEVEFFAPLRPGALIYSQATIETIEPAPSGERMTVELPARDSSGALVQNTRFTVFIRGPRGARAALARPSDSVDHSEPPLVEENYPVALDLPRRYAEASGDFNPIHLEEAVARMAGLPGVILHGLCTMALCSRAVVDRLCEGDPARLRRLRVRFSRPVIPGQTITIRIWRGKGAQYDFEAYNPAGQAVIRAGYAQID